MRTKFNDEATVGSKTNYPEEGVDNVQLKCNAYSSGGIVSFEWYKDGTRIPNANTMKYPLPGNKRANSGSYQCKAVSNQAPISPISDEVIITFLCKYCWYRL